MSVRVYHPRCTRCRQNYSCRYRRRRCHRDFRRCGTYVVVYSECGRRDHGLFAHLRMLQMTEELKVRQEVEELN